MRSAKSTFTVAVVGPDGAGKTSVCRALEQQLPVPCKYVYMGYNPEMSGPMLPMTRLMYHLKGAGETSRHSASLPKPDHGDGRLGLMKSIKASIGLLVRVCEEWHRQQYARRFLRRGFIIVYDRHFLMDYWANLPPIGTRSVFNKIHGWILEATIAQPDLVIYLDAPAELLFARKREGTLSSLEAQRQGFLSFGARIPNFRVVDAILPMEQVVVLALAAVTEFHGHHTKIFCEKSLDSRSKQKALYNGPW